MRGILRLFLRLLFRVRLSRRSSLPGDGPVLYLARHRSPLDSLVLPLFLPHAPLVVLPREEARPYWRRWLLSGVPHALLDVNDPAALKKVLRLLGAGRSVVLYPEGRIVAATSVMKTYDVPAL